MADVTPLRPQVVPAYMGCDFAVRIRRDGMPEIIGRRTGVAYYEVRKAPGGGPEAGLIAEEICDHLNGRETSARENDRLRAENADLRERLARAGEVARG